MKMLRELGLVVAALAATATAPCPGGNLEACLWQCPDSIYETCAAVCAGRCESNLVRRRLQPQDPQTAAARSQCLFSQVDKYEQRISTLEDESTKMNNEIYGDSGSGSGGGLSLSGRVLDVENTVHRFKVPCKDKTRDNHCSSQGVPIVKDIFCRCECDPGFTGETCTGNIWAAPFRPLCAVDFDYDYVLYVQDDSNVNDVPDGAASRAGKWATKNAFYIGNAALSTDYAGIDDFEFCAQYTGQLTRGGASVSPSCSMACLSAKVADTVGNNAALCPNEDNFAFNDYQSAIAHLSGQCDKSGNTSEHGKYFLSWPAGQNPNKIIADDSRFTGFTTTNYAVQVAYHNPHDQWHIWNCGLTYAPGQSGVELGYWGGSGNVPVVTGTTQCPGGMTTWSEFDTFFVRIKRKDG